LWTDVLLVSPTGQHLKYIVQLAFPQEGCNSSTVEYEGLLAGMRIVVGLGVTHLTIRGDSQLMVGQVGEAGMSPLIKAYAGAIRRLERYFSSLELEHIPHG
jgi:ribonuclease HI